MNKARLVKLAEFLWDLEPEKFDFSNVVSAWDEKSHCGTVCCAIGYTPQLFPDDVEWCENCMFGSNSRDVQSKHTDKVAGYVEVAAELFDIHPEHANNLFTPLSLRDPWTDEMTDWGTTYDFPDDVTLLDEDATPKQVSSMIYTYIKAMESKEQT
jgi:hypothetical protein